MLFSIKGNVDLIEDGSAKYISIILPQNKALYMLEYIIALETKRIGAFKVIGDNTSVTFRNGVPLDVTVQSPKNSFTDSISESNLSLMKCCIIDAALNIYINPHIDFESPLCDITFGFSDS